MRFRVRHLTRYVYETPVFLEPHVLRLTPRSDAGQRLERFDLRIDPQPAGSAANVDIDGNQSVSAWFEGPAVVLEVEAEAEVDTLRSNPFDYLWPGERSLPPAYDGVLATSLSPYLARPRSRQAESLASRLAAEAGADPQAFLLLLCRHVGSAVRHVVRPQGPPRPPDETLGMGAGACRDMAVVFIAACRAQGFAARFVSGYHAAAGAHDAHELHAWAEVYVPGGGWRGFDPSTGLAVADEHVALAAAAEPALAAPVSGSYRGRARLVSFETRVDVWRL